MFSRESPKSKDKEDPQRLFRIGDGSKATSYWWKKNTPTLNKVEQIV